MKKPKIGLAQIPARQTAGVVPGSSRLKIHICERPLAIVNLQHSFLDERSPRFKDVNQVVPFSLHAIVFINPPKLFILCLFNARIEWEIVVLMISGQSS